MYNFHLDSNLIGPVFHPIHLDPFISLDLHSGFRGDLFEGRMQHTTFLYFVGYMSCVDTK